MTNRNYDVKTNTGDMVTDFQEIFCNQENVLNMIDNSCFRDAADLNRSFFCKSRVYYEYNIILQYGRSASDRVYTSLEKAVKDARELSGMIGTTIVIRKDLAGTVLKKWVFFYGVQKKEVDMTVKEEAKVSTINNALIKHRHFRLEDDWSNEECHVEFDLGVINEADAHKIAADLSEGGEYYLEECRQLDDEVTMAWLYEDGITKTVGKAVDIEIEW